MTVKVNGKKILAGELTREASEDNLGQTVTFEAIPLLKNGDKVKIYEDGALKYSGMIIKVIEKTMPPHSYKARDYAFNLESEDHMQVKDRTDNAIKGICKKFGIPCRVTSIPTKIKKLYPDMPISEIIQDILKVSGKEQNKEYRLSVDCGEVVVEEKGKEKVEIPFLLSDETETTRSIENLKNSVKIVSDNGKNAKVYAAEKDNASIKKYGLLQTVETVEADNISKASTIAKNRLGSLNKEAYEKPVKILIYGSGAWDIKPGQLIKIKKEWHRIRSLTHTMEDGLNTLQISLRWKK